MTRIWMCTFTKNDRTEKLTDGGSEDATADGDVPQWSQARRCCCWCCITSPAVHRRVAANLDRGEQPLPRCPCWLHRGMCRIINFIIWLFFFQVSFQLLKSLVCHWDTQRPTGSITLNSYFLKCNICGYQGATGLVPYNWLRGFVYIFKEKEERVKAVIYINDTQ